MRKRKKSNIYLIILFVIIISGIIFITLSKKETNKNNNTFVQSILNSKPEFRMIEYLIQPQEAFVNLYNILGLTINDMQNFVFVAEDVYDLGQIKAGNSIRSFFDPTDNQFLKMEYQIDDQSFLKIGKDADSQLKAEIIKIEYEIRLNSVNGTIEDSLFQSGQKLGLKDKTIIELADVFAWDINFALDIRGGDKFNLLYEEHYLDGVFVKPGKILITYFKNKDEDYWGVFYEDEDGNTDYYDLSGNNLRKQFLKSPLRYKYISSYYSLYRFHPVWNVYTTHRAIDFAAPCGTPISAAGEGTITFVGWKNNVYGRTIEISHNGIYKTRYGHLSAYSRGIKYGSRVSQGQTIGFVGTSGTSTGCHLDYAMSKYNEFINPLIQNFDPVNPISEKNMGNFKFERDNLMNILNGYK